MPAACAAITPTSESSNAMQFLADTLTQEAAFR
ncbi:MAG: hypothetical protein CM15mP117_04230 [Alphaproteobacteria bacterium]|nr:MAG: hypothetical protein CM15mP117_04230 [Alphaproteobacteria bacterium]